MSNHDSYVDVPATTQEEVIAKEHHDLPIESSEIHTLAEPETSGAPNLSSPTLMNNDDLYVGVSATTQEEVIAKEHHVFLTDPLKSTLAELETPAASNLSVPTLMNNDDSYVGVPATQDEVIAKELHDLPIESSEIHTPAELETPAASNLSAPTLAWKSLITPIGTLILGVVLALVHHAFNDWEKGKPVEMNPVPQHWVTLIGVGFSFGFKSAIGVTMGFVLLQCLWLSVVRKPLTIQQIDTMYRIERQDQLYKTLPRALFFSPTIVVFSALTLLLPLSGVFAPGSLTVTTINVTDVRPFKIPTGNLSAVDTSDSFSLYTADIWGRFSGITPRAKALTLQWFVEKSIPDLPQACGPNCLYNVSVPSFVFQCTPNPPSLPNNQLEWGHSIVNGTTFWNGTTDPNSPLGFYIAWQSSGGNGTWGNASCSPVLAQYDIQVQTKGGVQSVTMNIAQVSPIPDITEFNASNQDQFWNIPANMRHFVYQVTAISYATRALFLGQALILPNEGNIVVDNRTVGQPSFLDIVPGNEPQFIWGDVLNGVEEMSRNVTAALLTLQLGTMSANCSFDQPVVVYQYNSFALWVPYSTAVGIALLSLIVAIMIMARNDTGDITTSFSDTAILTRNMDEEVSAGAKLRLRAAEDGKLEYKLE